MNTGDTVKRLDGGWGYEGRIGTIVQEDKAAGRYQVIWTKQPNRDGSYKEMKLKTWIKKTSVTKGA